VIFVANGGWSAHLRDGRVLAAAWRQAAAFTVPLRLRTGLTPWVRWGWWPWAGAAALVLAAAWALRHRAEPGSGGHPAGALRRRRHLR
jgi:apolipoprotein N-acyltransferase